MECWRCLRPSSVASEVVFLATRLPSVRVHNAKIGSVKENRLNEQTTGLKLTGISFKPSAVEGHSGLHAINFSLFAISSTL